MHPKKNLLSLNQPFQTNFTQQNGIARKIKLNKQTKSINIQNQRGYTIIKRGYKKTESFNNFGQNLSIRKIIQQSLVQGKCKIGIINKSEQFEELKRQEQIKDMSIKKLFIRQQIHSQQKSNKLELPENLSEIQIKKRKSSEIERERKQLEKDLGLFGIEKNPMNLSDKDNVMDEILNMSSERSFNRSQISQMCKRILNNYSNSQNGKDKKQYSSQNESEKRRILLNTLTKDNQFLRQIQNHPKHKSIYASQNNSQQAQKPSPFVEKDNYKQIKTNKKIKLGSKQRITLIQKLKQFIDFAPSTLFNYDFSDLHLVLIDLEQISIIGHICNTYLGQNQHIRWEMLSSLLYIEAYQELMRIFFVNSTQKTENLLFYYLQELARRQIQNLLSKNNDKSECWQFLQISQLQIMIYECKKIWENISYMLAVCQLKGLIPDDIRACLDDFKKQHAQIWDNFSNTKGIFTGNFISFEKQILQQTKLFVKDILKQISKKKIVTKYQFCLCKCINANFIVQRRYWMRKYFKYNHINKQSKQFPDNAFKFLQEISNKIRNLQYNGQDLNKITKETLKHYRILLQKNQ